MIPVLDDEPGCTCYCVECWYLRDECRCVDGPSGEVAGTCPTCGWLAQMPR